MIRVVKEPEGAGPPYERCCFCWRHTTWWHAKKDVAVCPECATTHKTAQIPKKADWCKQTAGLDNGAPPMTTTNDAQAPAPSGSKVYIVGPGTRGMAELIRENAPGSIVELRLTAHDGDILAKVTAMSDEQVLAAVPSEEIAETRRAFERAKAEAHSAPATVEMREAAKNLIASRSSTYKAKNGRVMGIEDDAGEMMWIVPFDEMAALEAALAPATEGRKG